jgi:hypothetical protein
VAIQQVAIVSFSEQTDPDDVTRVAIALNRQVMDDFAPIWRVPAMVHAVSATTMLPFNSYLLMILDDIEAPEGITGFHTLDSGRPVALIQYSHSWSLAASHELLEMLVDPTGNLYRTAKAPGDSPHKVDYLVEVCDPCQAPQDYHVNSVLVSDFITPAYYDPVAAPGARYSFTGAVRAPRTLLHGGYLTYREPGTRQLFEVKHGGLPRAIGTPPLGVSDRTWVDARTSHPDLCGVPPDCEALASARASEEAAAKARLAVAREIDREIEAIVRGGPPEGAPD